VEIYYMFERAFSEGQMEKWAQPTYDSYKVMDLLNHYFTPRNDAPDMIAVPFGKDIDPKRVLEELGRVLYIHGEENVVQYYDGTGLVDRKRR
jgi:hypothetical protein